MIDTTSRRPRHPRSLLGRAWVVLVCLWAASLWFGCTPRPTAVETGSGADYLVLWDVRLIDGTGAPAREHQAVVVSGGRIVDLGPIDEVTIPEGSERIDLAGNTVIPGLVDLHVHFPSDRGVQEAILQQLLEFGITTILNPGARPDAGVELRGRIERGEVVGPRMFSAGRIVERTPAEEGLQGWVAEVDSVEAIHEEVRAQVASGVDFVKLYRNLPPELVAAAIETAHEARVPVVGHQGETWWGEAARLGIDMLVHSGWGTPMDEVVDLEDPATATDRDWYLAYSKASRGARFSELARTLAEEDVVVVPTVSITQASGLGRDATLLPSFRTDLAPDRHLDDWWSDGWQERHPQYGPDSEVEAEMMATVYFPGVLANLHGFFEHGVRLAVGTDVGNSWMTPGFVYHHELELYQDAGIPALDILSMATRHGAEALGILDETGTLEVGKRADLVVLRDDPSLDVRATRSIERVFLGGREVPRPEGDSTLP